MVGWHTVSWLLEVDIGVSEGSAGDHVPADPDREDSSGGAEFLIQHGLCHICMEIPDVQGGHGVTGSARVHFVRWRMLAKYSGQWWNNFLAKVRIWLIASAAVPASTLPRKMFFKTTRQTNLFRDLDIRNGDGKMSNTWPRFWTRVRLRFRSPFWPVTTPASTTRYK